MKSNLTIAVALCAGLLLLPLIVHAQHKQDKDYFSYMESAQKKRKTANILAITGGAGLALGTSAVILHSTRNERQSDNAMGETYSVIGTMAISFLGIGGGSVASLASVPFYIGASRNKKTRGKIGPDRPTGSRVEQTRQYHRSPDGVLVKLSGAEVRQKVSIALLS